MKIIYLRFMLVYTAFILFVVVFESITNPTGHVPLWFCRVLQGWLLAWLPVVIYGVVRLWQIIGEEWGE